VSQSFLSLAKSPTLGDGAIEATNWDPTYAAYPQIEKAYQAAYGSDAQSYAVQAYLGVQLIAKATTRRAIRRLISSSCSRVTACIASQNRR
jgi:hypothetical protein